MSATLVLERATEQSSDIGQRCGVYRSEFGLAARFDPDIGAIRLKAESVSGVMVPATLGRNVLTLLDAVPVFSIDHRGHHVWMLLAQAPTSRDEAEHLTFRLFNVGVKPVFSRATIAVPTPGDPRRVWLYPPRGRTRPTPAALCEAIIAAATHGAERAHA
ncbi:MAG: hypothetical protein J2P17_09300 [Mycobacterium sp.]|nr:hypothetical protein [Mycobacterium sp.]